MDFKPLVEEFAHHVIARTEAFADGDVRTANRHAKKLDVIFDKLRAHGNAGRDALATLFPHTRMDVRVMAAVFLLRHRTEEAKAVLQEAAKGEGLTSFGAAQALQRWEEGTWALDPG